MIQESKLNIVLLLDPSDLTADFKDNLLLKARKKLEKTCNMTVGHILDILRLEDISEGSILPSRGTCKFSVTAIVNSVKPKIGDIGEGIIQNIFNGGFICTLLDVITFCVMTEDSSYQIGDSVSVRIIDVTCENDQFTGVGEIYLP